MNETLKGVAHIGAELAAAKADLQLEMERHRKTWRQLEQVTGLLRSALPHACHRRDIQDLDTPDGYAYASGLQLLIDNIDAALPQQAEPVRCEYCDGTGDVHRADGEWLGECKECDAAEPAPAQDEREAFEAYLVAHHGHQPYTLRSLRKGDSYPGVALPLAWSVWQARPAQTEQQPVCWASSAALAKLQNGRNNSPCVLTDGPAEFNDTPLFAAPIAQTVPQPEQSGLPLEPTEAMLDAYWEHTGESVEMRGRVHDRARRLYAAMAGAALSATPSPATAPSHE